MLFCNGLAVVRTYWKMPESAMFVVVKSSHWICQEFCLFRYGNPILKTIALCVHPDNDLTVYEDMKPIEHVLLHPICVLSHLMCASKNCNVNLSLYYWTHWSCWWIYHFKKYRFNAIFYKNQDTQKKPQWSPAITCGNTPTTVTWGESWKIYCRIYCYVTKTNSRKIR